MTQLGEENLFDLFFLQGKYYNCLVLKFKTILGTIMYKRIKKNQYYAIMTPSTITMFINKTKNYDTLQ